MWLQMWPSHSKNAAFGLQLWQQQRLRPHHYWVVVVGHYFHSRLKLGEKLCQIFKIQLNSIEM